MRVGLTRRFRPGDVVYWQIPAGPQLWPTEGVSKIESTKAGVHRMHDGQLVTTDEIRELIAAGDRPRTARGAA